MKSTLLNYPSAEQLQSWKGFVAAKSRRVAEFFSSQGITTAGNLLYGFLCVRLLPIPDYAEFAVVFGFLGSLTVLMDIGMSGALLPLVGERIDDSQLIADCVASLRHLAHWLYLAVAPAIVIAFPFLVKRQHWGWNVLAAMVAILLVAGWSARVSGAYGAVLIIRRDRTIWYRVQMIASLGTLFMLGVVWSFHWLSAFSAILINVSGIVFCALAYFIRARQLLGVKGHASKEKQKAIVHLTLPSMPNSIFYALQGQISLLLITWFGRTRAVAGLGALNRLSRVFVLPTQMNPILLEPFFAKLPKSRLKRNYLGAFAMESAFCLLVIGVAAKWPGIFLWVLGPKYAGLRLEVLLTVVATSISYLCDTMWTIHVSRRFVYWWSGIALIAYSLLTEILFIWKADLTTIRGVLTLMIALASGALVIQILVGICGFVWGPRCTTLAAEPPAGMASNIAEGEF